MKYFISTALLAISLVNIYVIRLMLQNEPVVDFHVENVVEKPEPAPAPPPERKPETVIAMSFEPGNGYVSMEGRYNDSKPKIRDEWYVWKERPLDSLKNLATLVLTRIPFMKGDAGTISLLAETVNVENSPLPAQRAKEIFDWLERKHWGLHNCIKLFRREKLSFEDDLKGNVPLNMALAAAIYWANGGAGLHKRADTLEKRAGLYESLFMGKFDRGQYIQKNGQN